MKIYRAELFNNKILHSLRKIQAARIRIHSLTASNSTPITLVSQIRFCDILLGEIQAIHSSLRIEGPVGCRAANRRRPVVARHYRSNKFPIVAQGNPATGSGQGR
jgi:hypothetical protein